MTKYGIIYRDTICNNCGNMEKYVFWKCPKCFELIEECEEFYTLDNGEVICKTKSG